MKIVVEINLCTDGDYYLDDNFSDIRFEHDDGTDCWDSIVIFDNDEGSTFKPDWYARDYIAKVMSCIRVGFTHVWLIDELYHMFDGAINYLLDRSIDKKKSYYNCLGGNYEGTEIRINIID